VLLYLRDFATTKYILEEVQQQLVGNWQKVTTDAMICLLLILAGAIVPMFLGQKCLEHMSKAAIYATKRFMLTTQRILQFMK
jgi:hypothetical protein